MEEPKSTTNQDGHSELEQQQKEIEYADINKELEKLKEEKRLEIDRLARLKEEQSKIESQHKENEKSDNKLVNPVSDFKNFIERLNRELSDLPITNRAGKTWHIKYEITDLDLEKTNSLSKPYIATAVLKDVGFYNDDDVVRSAIRFTYSNDQWVFTESKMVNKFSKPPYSYKDLEFFPPQPDGQDPIILEAVQRANSE